MISMEYKETLEYIHNTNKFGIKLGLKNIKELLKLLGNPQEKLKFIHISGTNGKGSTAAFISNVLIEEGYQTGLFTSPYIEEFNERIQINNKKIPHQDIIRITHEIKNCIEIMTNKGLNHPTEFEIVTALAMKYFYIKKCDFVVLEVGMGGRFDATNIIKNSIVSVITKISLDHIEYLGDTIKKIAYEKAGIIKDNVPVVLYSKQDEVKEVIREIAIEKNARIIYPDFNRIINIDSSLKEQIFDYKDYKNIKIKLLGEHQKKNCIIAIEALEIVKNKGFRINKESIMKGLYKTRWIGRMEVLSYNPCFIIDGAHNKDGAIALVESMKQIFKEKKITFIFGVLKDKDIRGMVNVFSTIAKRFILITPNNNRGFCAKNLADIVKTSCNDVFISDTIELAILRALNVVKKDDIICSLGSLSYIGEVRRIFINYKNNKK